MARKVRQQKSDTSEITPHLPDDADDGEEYLLDTRFRECERERAEYDYETSLLRGEGRGDARIMKCIRRMTISTTKFPRPFGEDDQ